jgi:hypothetical protein
VILFSLHQSLIAQTKEGEEKLFKQGKAYSKRKTTALLKTKFFF